MHSQTFQDTVINAWDFEFAKLEANYAQAVNLVINGSSELNSKLKQFSDSIDKKLENSSNQSLKLCQQSLRTGYTQNLSSQNYLSLLITPEDAISHNLETKQTQLLTTNNILPATIMEDELLTAIFSFKIEELSEIPLFSGAALEEKPIMTMYTNTKINEQAIKLILNSKSANNIIT
ncbi:hypothetical protein G9A89_022901 [Geosiphon pyriformis]|nr:hypothetical protein G9A89_022901 [Geosiphon pyriformis]